MISASLQSLSCAVFWKAALLGAFVVGSVSPALGQTRILFVGNSLTHGRYSPVLNYNAAAVTDENSGLPANNPRYHSDPTEPGAWGGVPGIFKRFADQVGLNYVVHLEAISGVTLQYHHANALAVIQQSKWDQVVLQELSTLPLPVARSGQPTVFADYATRLQQAVHSANPAAQVYLYQSWARPDLTYPTNRPYSGLPIDAMTQDLHDAYFNLAASNPRFAAVAPVGDAWLRAIQAGVAVRNPYSPAAGQLNLWDADFVHASKWGSYLNACVLFYKITGYDPRALGGTEQAAAGLGITPTDASALQQIAYLQVRGGALPVTLTLFSAERQPAGVLLRWATASEENNRAFEVQRSADGTSFVTVASVAGHGNTSQPTSYSTTDRGASLGPLYYRLRQVDFDGQATFSPVAAVAGSDAAGFVLFPNPAHELNILAQPTATAYRVRNTLGQVLLQGSVAGGRATVGLEALPTGMYLVEVETGTGRAVRRFQRE